MVRFDTGQEEGALAYVRTTLCAPNALTVESASVTYVVEPPAWSCPRSIAALRAPAAGVFCSRQGRWRRADHTVQESSCPRTHLLLRDASARFGQRPIRV